MKTNNKDYDEASEFLLKTVIRPGESVDDWLARMEEEGVIPKEEEDYEQLCTL